jgi:hypothetical protein
MEKIESPYIKLLNMAYDDLIHNREIKYDDFKKRAIDLNVVRNHLPLWEKIYGPEHVSRSWLMNLEANMMLVDHRELQHSLDESKKAKRQALVATIVAIVSTILPFITWAIDKWKLL